MIPAQFFVPDDSGLQAGLAGRGSHRHAVEVGDIAQQVDAGPVPREQNAGEIGYAPE